MDASPLKSSGYKVVAVIHIGTPESRMAFSSTNQYLENPLNVTIQHWTDGVAFRDTTPKYSLFTKENKFKAFGFDAKSLYREHVDENTHTDVYCFERVIVDLFKNEVNGEFLSEDQTGKTMPSMDVLTTCINYLCVLTTDTVAKLESNLNARDIRWVLPVPVSWNNKSMSFMRTAAINVDFTVDITVHRASWNSHIREVYKTKVENLGNTPLEQLFADFFCSDVMDSYKVTHDFEYNDMKQLYGFKFEGIMPPTVRFLIPCSLLSHFDSKRSITFADHLTACYGGGIQITGDKLIIGTELSKPKFRDIYEHIVSTIQRTFDTFRLIGISAIVSVGNFSEYPMLHNVIKEAFPDKQIIIPENAKAAVIGGAVVYGHQIFSGEKNPQATENKLFSQY